MKRYVLTVVALMVLVLGCDTTDSPPIYQLKTNIQPADGGTVDPAGGEYEEGTKIVITASPNDNYLFQGWEGDVPNPEQSFFITFDGDKEITALFSLKEYTLNIEVEGEGVVNEEILTQPADNSYGHGTQVQVTAVAEPGWSFNRWEGDLTGTETPMTIEVDDEKSITAIFTQAEYVVNAGVDGEGDVQADPEQDVYYYQESVTLTAVSRHNTRFIEWQGDYSSTDSVLVIDSIEGNIDVTALFIHIEYPLWAMGYNHNGQLGDGTRNSSSTPVRNIYNVDQVSAGAWHSLYISKDGELWTMGYNSDGQLGDGTNIDRYTPVRVDENVLQVAGGEDHSLYLKEDGTLWAMGLNNQGQLGDGTLENRLNPVQVASDVTSISAGDTHSLFIKGDGTMWGMGNNNDGQLGVVTDDNISSTPVQIDSGVSNISAGGRHTIYLKNDGSMWAIGRNVAGQLGDGSTQNRTAPIQIIASEVSHISTGRDHTLFVRSDGTLWGMGNNSSGQLGLGDTSSRLDPVQLPASATVVHIDGGLRHTFYITSDKRLWAMGANDQGQLGTGSISDHQLEPVEVTSEVLDVSAGNKHSLFIKEE